MSYNKTYLSKLVKDDGYGSRQVDADYYWNENNTNRVVYWEPAARFPQLEELIAALKGLSIPIAGGAILGSAEALEFGDIDIFPLNEPDIDIATAVLGTLGYQLEEKLAHSLLFKHSASVYRQVQIITIHTDTADVYKVLARFDLSCVQLAVMDGDLYTTAISQQDVKERWLRCMQTLSVREMLDRIVKYRNRGFRFYDEENSEKVEIPKAIVVNG